MRERGSVEVEVSVAATTNLFFLRIWSLGSHCEGRCMEGKSLQQGKGEEGRERERGDRKIQSMEEKGATDREHEERSKKKGKGGVSQM